MMTDSVKYLIIDFSDHKIEVDGIEVEGWAALASPQGIVALGQSAQLALLVEHLESTR